MAHELEARMRSVETGQATTQQLITDHIKVVDKLLTKHDKILLGTGENNNPGLVTRLDREEQKSKTITRLIWLVVTGVVGTGVTLAATAIF